MSGQAAVTCVLPASRTASCREARSGLDETHKNSQSTLGEVCSRPFRGQESRLLGQSSQRPYSKLGREEI